jgi:hypothetical protein
LGVFVRHPHAAAQKLVGWLRVTAAAISSPGGVERSRTQKPRRPGNAFTWNRSTSQISFLACPFCNFPSDLHTSSVVPRSRSDFFGLWWAHKGSNLGPLPCEALRFAQRFRHSHAWPLMPGPKTK